MAINFHYSLEEMNEVLVEILKHEEVNNFGPLVIESYQNGREQGYSLVYLDEKNEKEGISFAIQRNSDDIILYFGEREKTGISQEAYSNYSDFSPGDYESAVDFIFSALDAVPEDKRTNGSIKLHPSLSVAKEILDKVIEDDRSKNINATIESMHDGDVNGYRLVRFGSPMFDIGIGREENKIAIYKGSHAMQGLPYDGNVQRFELEDINDAVEYIFLIFDLN